jgi:propanol-preferring alcohol dehydrogenase
VGDLYEDVLAVLDGNAGARLGCDSGRDRNPSGDVVLAALKSIARGGIVAINAIPLDRMPQFDYDTLLWEERSPRSVANMTRQDGRDFLKVAAEINLTPSVQTFGLEQANDALRTIDEDKSESSVVLLPHG